MINKKKVRLSPIFIIGIGRSGSTIFHKMLCEHPALYWLSERICNRFPNNPIINNFLMCLVDKPIIGNRFRKWFYPGEVYNFWNFYFRGFSNPYRDLTKADVTNRAKKDIRNIFKKLNTARKVRHLVKITGWNRIGFLYEIFPDAKFIHVKRDPRAVINSFLNVEFWSGWRGPLNWRMGPISEDQKKELETFNHSFVALAGIKLELLQNALELAVNQLPKDRFLEIKYEDLCENAEFIIKEFLDFSGLEWNAAFEARLRKYNLKNTNYKWKQDLTKEQQNIAQYYYEKLEY